MSFHAPERVLLETGYSHHAELVSYLEDLYPQLGGRALRAGVLAAANMVTFTDDGFTVQSGRSADQAYSITCPKTSATQEYMFSHSVCTCYDWVKGTNGKGAPVLSKADGARPMCKHILAAWMDSKIAAGWSPKKKAPAVGPAEAKKVDSVVAAVTTLAADSTPTTRSRQQSPRSPGDISMAYAAWAQACNP